MVMENWSWPSGRLSDVLEVRGGVEVSVGVVGHGGGKLVWVLVCVKVRWPVRVGSFVRDWGSAGPTKSGLGAPVEAVEPEVCHSVSDKRMNC